MEDEKLKVFKTKKRLATLLTVLSLVVISFALYGCAKKSTPSTSVKKKTVAPAKAVVKAKKTSSKVVVAKSTPKSTLKTKNLEPAAMKIIKDQSCMSCHVINGKGGSIGPNLSKEGTKGHSIHWLEVQINTPKVHSPNTMMPNHNLNPVQLETVAEYLDSLK